MEQKEYRYYLRNAENKPVVTVVLIKTGNLVSRGISICSPLDNPRKVDGYNRAKGRAVKALYQGHDCEPVCRIEAERILWQVNSQSAGLNESFWHKCSLNPTLLPYEQKILGVQS